jgi:hypothetical protein
MVVMATSSRLIVVKNMVETSLTSLSVGDTRYPTQNACVSIGAQDTIGRSCRANTDGGGCWPGNKEQNDTIFQLSMFSK